MALYDADNAVFEVAGVAYRPFPRGGFDLERRFKDMDAAEVDVQVLSATPQTYLYDQEAALGARRRPSRTTRSRSTSRSTRTAFPGFATLPMQAPEMAADERRAMRKLGLNGAMFGSNIGARISTIRASSRCGRRPTSSTPSC